MSNDVRVRYAPSPTGHLHIGNARTALFNYLFARSQGGRFIVRIEDTDTKRNVAGGEENQLAYLKWLGIDWDESIDIGGGYGPYRQTERLELYRASYEELLERGLAYRCYCTEEELEQEREAQLARGETPRYSGAHRNLSDEQRTAYEAEGRVPSIRFRVPDGKAYAFDDMVKGTIRFEAGEFGDFVIVKKDGIPTYNFAVAVDDHHMKISHVLRGEDHITNTPRQLMIYEALGWEPPRYGHMTLIVNEQRKKLSKRDESIIQFIEQYDELGYLPEALFNFIALLGWSPEGEQEVFTREELVQAFDAARLSKSPAVFDTNKLAWMNGEYIKAADPLRIAELCRPHLQRAGRIGAEQDAGQRAWTDELVALYQDKLRCAADIVPLTALFFAAETTDEPEAREVLGEEQVPQVLRAFLAQIEQATALAEGDVKAMVKTVQKETGCKGKQLFMPIRAAVTGQTHGPDLNRTIALLGADKVAARLRARLA
ncbi:glutamate--tRNA ligase [Paenibacillus sp. IB182496]|uniref:Glutamate--tRNA ligase n=1 Tax=Paenibacillus sabuli TaxID=2772509 RepID=A0A927BR55_9BACL|nr:glutamate--tRNA ligase [Paenibacillus sabuli]MBD2844747.1 glutamate--tRNA ligase [Paenibacillus sabuli]